MCCGCGASSALPFPLTGKKQQILYTGQRQLLRHQPTPGSRAVTRTVVQKEIVWLLARAAWLVQNFPLVHL